MQYWILKENNKIIESGFDVLNSPPYSLVEFDIHKYNINDCLLAGTDFQIAIWKAIASIPVGNVVSYGELVKLVGRGSPQAAGTACGKNKIPVIIPCHRVVGKTNPLAFSAGADIKRQLLAEEGVVLP